MALWVKLLLFFILPLSLFSDQNKIIERIQNHFIVKDFHSSLQESKEAISKYPDSKQLQELHLKSLALLGREKEMLTAWKDFNQDVGEGHLETLAWSIIKKGGASPSIRYRMASMFGALGTRDAYAVDIFMQNMSGDNSFLRSLAARLTPAFRDKKLQQKVLDLLNKDPVWYVRFESVLAAGRMRMKSAKSSLHKILLNPNRPHEEKMAAINALMEIYEAISEEEFNSLISSEHMEFRLLACEMVARFNLKEHVKKMVSLLKDPHAEVRIAVLNVLGILHIDKLEKKPVADLIADLVDDFHFGVAITAARLSLVNGSQKGEETLEKFVFRSNPEERRLAAAAIKSAGKYGVKLASRVLRKSKDPYVRANLAFGLICQREDLDESCKAILHLLQNSNESLMWDNTDNPIFPVLSPTALRHRPDIVNFPELVNQRVRLELLSILAILEHPKAKDAIKQFLREKRWDITGIATLILLEECDESAMELIYELLLEKDVKIKVQAALVLANWSKDERAIKVLQDSYQDADRELKLRILESFGRFTAKHSSSFLTKVILQEQSSILRITAAASLVQALNN